MSRSDGSTFDQMRDSEDAGGVDELREILRAHEKWASGEDESHWNGDNCSVMQSPTTGGLVYRVVVALSHDFLPGEVQVHVDQSAGTLVVVAEHSEVQPGKRVQRSLRRSFQPPPGTDLGHLAGKFSTSKDAKRWLLLEAPFLGHPVTHRLLSASAI